MWFHDFTGLQLRTAKAPDIAQLLLLYLNPFGDLSPFKKLPVKTDEGDMNSNKQLPVEHLSP